MRCPHCHRLLLPGGSCPTCPPTPAAAGPAAAAVTPWGAPRPSNAAAPADLATVISRPMTTTVTGPPNRGLRALAIVLAALLVATSPGLLANLLGALFVPLLALIVLVWLLSRFGLLSVLSWLTLRPRASRTPSTELVFRCERSGQACEVRLRGHSSGVAVGDQVSVRGVTLGGVLHAGQVRNTTTGAVLSRPALAGTIGLVIVDTALILTVLGHIL